MAPWDDNDMGDELEASQSKPLRNGKTAMILYIDIEDHKKFKLISGITSTPMVDIIRAFIRRFIKRNEHMIKRSETLRKQEKRNG